MSEAAIAHALGRDIEGGRLALAYQPKIDLRTGAFDGVEALMRWSPEGIDPVPPDRFIAVAESSGLIDQLTEWGLTTALRQLAAWDSDGLEVSLAFNLSAVSLARLDIPDLVERRCREAEISPARLIMELTEGATQPLVNLLDTLTRFRIKGIGLSIDDYGVGYSTLMQLRQLPFTELKIDRFFVADAHSNLDSGLITKSIVDLAHDLGLSVTGEGVETLEQFRHLRKVGCDHAQGYYLARPMPGDEIAAWAKDFAARWPSLIG